MLSVCPEDAWDSHVCMCVMCVLQAVLNKALSPVPEDRPSIDELVSTLNECVSQLEALQQKQRQTVDKKTQEAMLRWLEQYGADFWRVQAMQYELDQAERQHEQREQQQQQRLAHFQRLHAAAMRRQQLQQPVQSERHEQQARQQHGVSQTMAGCCEYDYGAQGEQPQLLQSQPQPELQAYDQLMYGEGKGEQLVAGFAYLFPHLMAGLQLQQPVQPEMPAPAQVWDGQATGQHLPADYEPDQVWDGQDVGQLCAEILGQLQLQRRPIQVELPAPAQVWEGQAAEQSQLAEQLWDDSEQPLPDNQDQFDLDWQQHEEDCAQLRQQEPHQPRPQVHAGAQGWNAEPQLHQQEQAQQALGWHAGGGVRPVLLQMLHAQGWDVEAMCMQQQQSEQAPQAAQVNVQQPQ